MLPRAERSGGHLRRQHLHPGRRCALFAFVFACLGASADAAAKFHIGIVTGTVSQSEDDLRGAEKMIQLYGDVANGGMVKHLTYPDNFMSEMETTIAQISGLADDPLMKVVVVKFACAHRKRRRKTVPALHMS